MHGDAIGEGRSEKVLREALRGQKVLSQRARTSQRTMEPLRPEDIRTSKHLQTRGTQPRQPAHVASQQLPVVSCCARSGRATFVSWTVCFSGQ